MIIGETYVVRRVNMPWILGSLMRSSDILRFYQLSNVKLIILKLNGVEYDIIYTGLPDERQVKFDPVFWTLTFNDEVSLNEKIYVMYQY